MDSDLNKNYTVAKENDGTIQITFTIPKDIISVNEKKALEELGSEIEVPGFRKGNAPIDRVKEHISKEKLVEKTLSGILPKMLTDALNTEKIRPSVFPKFELISSTEGEDWQVRAITCEILPFDLGNYKENIKGIVGNEKIWTPGNNTDNKENDSQQSRLEKEQKIIETLLKSVNIIVPKVLVDEEVNSRLSQLLSRIEKLGLNLESYLSSIGKNPQSIRDEYFKQSEESIKIELILEKIAQEENITVSQSEVDEAVKASSSDPSIKERLESPEQLNIIKTILGRRKALDFLLTLR